MTTRQALHDEVKERARPAAGIARDASWPLHAALAGFVGAFVVAFTFLIVDLAHGRPALWTPATLGRLLFLGRGVQAPGAFAPLDSLGLIGAYTLLHGVVFVAFGGIAAQVALVRERRWTLGGDAGLALGLFLALQLTFLGFAWVFEPELVAALGLGWISFANAAAAFSIVTMIVWAAERRRVTRAGGREGSEPGDPGLSSADPRRDTR